MFVGAFVLAIVLSLWIQEKIQRQRFEALYNQQVKIHIMQLEQLRKARAEYRMLVREVVRQPSASLGALTAHVHLYSRACPNAHPLEKIGLP